MSEEETGTENETDLSEDEHRAHSILVDAYDEGETVHLRGQALVRSPYERNFWDIYREVGDDEFEWLDTLNAEAVYSVIHLLKILGDYSGSDGGSGDSGEREPFDTDEGPSMVY